MAAKEIVNYFRTHKDVSEGITCVYKNSVSSPEEHRMHLNNMCEIYVFIDGEADYVVESMCFPLEPYDVIILNPYQPHTPLLKRVGRYERAYFLVPIDSFAFMDVNPMDVFLNERGADSVHVCLPPDKKRKLKGYLEIFKKPWSRYDRSASLVAYSVFLGVLSLLNEHLINIADQPGEDKSSQEPREDIPPIIFEVLRYVEKNLSTNFSEEDLAANFYISAPYLSRLFKTHIKMGLKKYILLRRVGNAKKLLGSGKSVTDTCFECGFNDCSYFIKVFKTYTGVTPYKYQISSKNITEDKKNERD